MRYMSNGLSLPLPRLANTRCIFDDGAEVLMSVHAARFYCTGCRESAYCAHIEAAARAYLYAIDAELVRRQRGEL